MSIRILCALTLALLSVAPQRLMADTKRSPDGAIPVQFTTSGIVLLTVRSTWATDYDYGLHMQGPIYFNDCVTFKNTAGTAATHIQFIFALVDATGTIKTPALPLDVRYSAEPNKIEDRSANCRDHAYGNGVDGLWLVAWANRVDFANGVSWTAPQGRLLTDAIRAALPRQRPF